MTFRAKNDNAMHRALFSLPPIMSTQQAEIAAPGLPPHEVVTGYRDVDALLWLRSIIATGEPELIAKAREAAERIKTPLKELENQYLKHLTRTQPRNPLAAMSAFDLSDIEQLVSKSTKKAQQRKEARARFGDDLFAETPAERFCAGALDGVGERTDECEDLEAAEVDARFDALPAERPATLADCLHELAYWDALYWLRRAVDSDCMDTTITASARREYAFRCLGRILPRSTEEAHSVLDYLLENDCMDWDESGGILRNLMTRTAGAEK